MRSLACALSQSMASALATSPWGAKPVAAKFSATMLAQVRSRSTNVADPAPRDKASMPSVPAPAKRSSTRAPRMLSPMMLNNASLTSDVVGRVARPGGVFSTRPRLVPAVPRAAERRLAGQSRVAVQEADGLGLGVADQRSIEQICHLELIAMLLDAMQVTHPAVLEVDLGQVEAAAMRNHSRQSSHRLGVVDVC